MNQKQSFSPKISVIIPVWNPGSGISRCVESLCSQTLEDIEIIFVDDCGTDGAMEVVRAAAVEDSRIRILTNEMNMGPGYSRNRGIEVAQGEYLSFVDPDDYLATDFLELLYRKVKEQKTDIAKGLMICEKTDGSPMWKNPQANKRLRIKLSNGIPLYRAFTRGHQTAIYRKEFILSNNILYSLARRGQDVVFLLKVCSNTNSISFTDDAHYYYCERKTSTVYRIGSKPLGYYFDSFRELVEYCLNCLPDNEYTKDYLQELFLAGIKEIYRYKDTPGMENDSRYYLSVLREQWLRMPKHEEWASDYCSLHVMQKYDYLLPTQVFQTAWDDPQSPVRNALLLKHWVDFYLANPGEREVLSHDLEKIIRQTETAVSKSNHYSSQKERKKGLAIFEEQMKRCGKEKTKSKQGVRSFLKRSTIRSFIAKIPLAKSLYKAVKQRREEQRMKCVHAQLRKKQPIIRQGSPECIEGLPLLVSWNVTSFCNFRCSYCFDAKTGYKKDFCTLEQAETAIRHIASANRPSYQVSLVGGEPTTHPHLAEIIMLLCQYLGDRLEQLGITTNGSFSESQMKAILKAGEQVRVKLIISVHLEYMDVERVVELVKQYSLCTDLNIHLMFHPELVDKAMSVADALIALRRDYTFGMYPVMLREPPLYDRFDSRYTQEHFNCAERIKERFGIVHTEDPEWPNKLKTKDIGCEFFVERDENGSVEKYERISPTELKKMTGNVFTGMTCCAGTSIVKILGNGKVKGMTCGLNPSMCNIFEENPFLRQDWMHGVVCTKAMCGCAENLRIPKFRSPVAAQKFIEEKRLEQKKLMRNCQDND